MTQPVDILVTHAHLFTMQGQGVGYVADGSLAIHNGKILATGATADLGPRYQTAELIDATGYAVLPGLIDAHMHTPESILRGVAQDVGHWMQGAMAPYERYLYQMPAAALAGTQLSVLEGLRAGTTTFGDFTSPYPGWPEVYARFGVRARLTPKLNALPRGGMAGWKIGDLYPFDDDRCHEMLDIAVGFVRDWQRGADGRITVMLGPQAPDMMAEEHLLEVKRIAEREGLMIHMHVAQGDREINQMLKRHGERTPAYLDRIGYLDRQLLAVHLTEATDAETALIATRGAALALCSGSIGIIDGIVPPAHVFRQHGGAVALGSDQAPGNNCMNIFNEMKLTALFNKIKYRDPTVMPAWEVLRMATIEAATALGLADEIGSLEPGKQADLILVDLAEPNLCPMLEDPVRNIVPNLVYSASGHEVKTAIVAGRVIMRDRRVLTVDEAAIRSEAQAQAEAISRRVAADPLHEGLVLVGAMRQGRL
jgi:5-methylthioadenosine/S-adenosylhomocysteine deaminase